jgi:hypothetical protein
MLYCLTYWSVSSLYPHSYQIYCQAKHYHLSEKSDYYCKVYIKDVQCVTIVIIDIVHVNHEEGIVYYAFNTRINEVYGTVDLKHFWSGLAFDIDKW